MPGTAGGERPAEETACESGEKRSMVHGTPSCSFRSAVSKSTRISRSRACRAAFSRWRVRARRQLAEQVVCRPRSFVSPHTGHRRPDPTTGVRTLSGGTLGSGSAWDMDQAPGVPSEAVERIGSANPTTCSWHPQVEHLVAKHL